jgi:GH15 family glucan-1,4-alpha-glucosidase
VADFTIAARQRLPFTLTWSSTFSPEPEKGEAEQSLCDPEVWWQEWVSRCTYRGEWHEAVLRSLITLKALTYAPTGGVIAAVTTSLPEQLGL